MILQYLIPAALTAVFALVVGYLLWIIKRERFDLVYNVIESQSFPINGDIGRYFVISLINSGNRSIKDIDYKIIFTSGHPKNVNYSDLALIKTALNTDKEVSCQIPLLNPKESLEVTITATNNTPSFDIEIKARAEGVTAKRRSVQENWSQSLMTNILIPLTALAVSFGVSTIYNSYKQIRVQKQLIEIASSPAKTERAIEDIQATLEDRLANLDKMTKELETSNRQREQGLPENEQVIFRLLISAKLSNLIPEFMLNGEITFWQTGLFLTHAYAKDKANGVKYVNAMKEILNTPNIAPSSKGFIYYLLSRIELDRGQNEEAELYLKSCQKETPLMYEFLIERDRDFKIDDLQ